MTLRPQYLVLSYLAVLITGGNHLDTAELYLPSLGTSCSLPSLPEVRAYHTGDNDILCGGFGNSDCLQWSPSNGSWEELVALDSWNLRYYHVSWTPGSGIGTYLMGGTGSGRTSTLIKPDGTQETGFTLKYDTKWVLNIINKFVDVLIIRYACAIPDPDTNEASVVVTGGAYTRTTVSIYTEQGWQRNLPPLNTGRESHACSSFMSGGGRVS